MKSLKLTGAVLLAGLACSPGPTEAAGNAEQPSAYMRPVGGDLLPHPPRGYTRVWTDGRLNPHRGPRTARGDAAMHRVWSEDTPMRLLSQDADRR